MDADLRMTLGKIAAAAEFLACDLGGPHWWAGTADDFREHAEYLETRRANSKDARHLARELANVVQVNCLTASPRHLLSWIESRDISESIRDAITNIVVALNSLQLETGPRVADISSDSIADLRTRAAELHQLVIFAPSELQREILRALNGKAMTADCLQNELNVGRQTLFGGKNDRGGLNELRKLGMLVKDRKVGGYFRPDAPPIGAPQKAH